MNRSIVFSWMMAAAAVVLLSNSANAQPSAAVPFCATLLTADELTKIVGEKMQDMGPRVRDSGESECSWMLRGGSKGFKTVSVQFYDMKVIKASPAAPTLPAFFEQIVSSGEGAASGKKREVLPGIGDKTAFVQTDPQVLAVVQRPDGVARIVGNNLTKAELTAVARAIVTP
jgi:hypothetical protein